MNKEKLEGAKNLFFIALGIDIAATTLVVGSDFWVVGVLRDVSAGITNLNQSAINTMEFWDSFSKVMFLTTIGVGLGLVNWLNACYRYTKEVIGASGFKNEGWTATGWIIPIFNLFKPYQIINEIYKAATSAYESPEGWKKESGSGLLLAWWIFYSVIHIILLIVSKQLFRNSTRDDLTFDQSINYISTHLWLCTVSAIIAIFWLVVAGKLTRNLINRRQISATTRPNQPSNIKDIRIEKNSTAPRTDAVEEFDHIKDSEQLGFNVNNAYRKIARELDTKSMDKGLWLMAMVQSRGTVDQNEQIFNFTRLRLQQLKEEFTAEQTESIGHRQVKSDSISLAKDSLNKIQVNSQHNVYFGNVLHLIHTVKQPPIFVAVVLLVLGLIYIANGGYFSKAVKSTQSEAKETVNVQTPVQEILTTKSGPTTIPYGDMKVRTNFNCKKKGETRTSNLYINEDLLNEAKNGDKTAMNMVAYYYLEKENNFSEAHFWFNKAIQYGDQNAPISMAELYYCGYSVPQNYARSRELLKQGGDLGSNMGYLNLGVMYELGDGVDKDEVAAYYWYKQSAKNGRFSSDYLRAIFHGVGTENNEKRAFMLLNKSVKEGRVKKYECFMRYDLYNLALMYLGGYGIEKNVDEAHKLLKEIVGLPCIMDSETVIKANRLLEIHFQK